MPSISGTQMMRGVRSRQSRDQAAAAMLRGVAGLHEHGHTVWQALAWSCSSGQLHRGAAHPGAGAGIFPLRRRAPATRSHPSPQHRPGPTAAPWQRRTKPDPGQRYLSLTAPSPRHPLPSIGPPEPAPWRERKPQHPHSANTQTRRSQQPSTQDCPPGPAPAGGRGPADEVLRRRPPALAHRENSTPWLPGGVVRRDTARIP